MTGARIGPGESRLVFGISGQRLGRSYAVAGLKITYRYEGRSFTAIAWSAALVCVVNAVRLRYDNKTCGAELNRVTLAARRLANISP